VAVDRLRHPRSGVAHEIRDLLDAHPLARQQRHEAVPQLPGRPVGRVQPGPAGDGVCRSDRAGRSPATVPPNRRSARRIGRPSSRRPGRPASRRYQRIPPSSLSRVPPPGETGFGTPHDGQGLDFDFLRRVVAPDLCHLQRSTARCCPSTPHPDGELDQSASPVSTSGHASISRSSVAWCGPAICAPPVDVGIDHLSISLRHGPAGDSVLQIAPVRNAAVRPLTRPTAAG
jgi:hypothetical protein